MAISDERATFNIEKRRFEHATEFSLRVSLLSKGLPLSLRFVLGSYVFTRMCVGAETISHLLDRGISEEASNTLDHFSIAVLCRNLIEGAVMLLYLTEPNISEAEWELRRKVLDLHDCLVRVRLFKGLGNEAKDEYRGWKARSHELRKEMEQLPAFRRLAPERREAISKQSEIYVDGLRAILRQIDMDRKYFDAVHHYLSSQVHVAPNSFYYMHENRIDFVDPAPYQLYIASFAIANARYFLLPAALRVASIDSKIIDSIGSSVLDEMKVLGEMRFGEDG